MSMFGRVRGKVTELLKDQADLTADVAALLQYVIELEREVVHMRHSADIYKKDLDIARATIVRLKNEGA